MVYDVKIDLSYLDIDDTELLEDYLNKDFILEFKKDDDTLNPIVHIDLSANKITDQGLIFLLEWCKKQEFFVRFDLSDQENLNFQSQALSRVIQDLPALDNILSFCLSRNKIGSGEGFFNLVQLLLKCRKCADVDLSNCELSCMLDNGVSDGIAHQLFILANFHKTMETLTLSYNHKIKPEPLLTVFNKVREENSKTPLRQIVVQGIYGFEIEPNLAPNGILKLS